MLKAKDIWSLIVDLSSCQKKFAKLKEELENDTEKDEILEEWAKNKFSDRLDFIERMEFEDEEE